MTCSASLVIATRNRRDELRAALHSASTQTVPPEVLVLDDASSDGTREMVQGEFPGARYFRSEQPLGCSAQRNRGIQMASAPIVFSLDDDARYAAPDTIERTLRAFANPRVAAVAMPFINVRSGPAVLCRAPDAARVWVTDAFVGAAAALRRDPVLRCGGFREHWNQYGEESDLSLRLLDAGYVTCLGNAAPAEHFESARRDHARWNYLGRRNDILFVLESVPLPWLLVHLPATTVNGMLTGLRSGYLSSALRGVAAGYRDGWRRWPGRKPVSVVAYRLHRRLKKRGPLELAALEPLLPALAPAQQAA
ncbi:MAG: glycosyltransferase family 2 protein [Steroidobacteraceae bacterium]